MSASKMTPARAWEIVDAHLAARPTLGANDVRCFCGEVCEVEMYTHYEWAYSGALIEEQRERFRCPECGERADWCVWSSLEEEV